MRSQELIFIGMLSVFIANFTVLLWWVGLFLLFLFFTLRVSEISTENASFLKNGN